MAVFFDRVESYEVKLIEASINRALNKLGVVLSDKKRVILKPNLVRPAKPGSAIVTHPVVIEALIDVLRGLGTEEIIIAEGSALGVDVNEAFRLAGYTQLARRKGVLLVDLTKAERREREWSYGKLELPKVFFECDLYINVPKMKTHFHTTVSLSQKNQFGLIAPLPRKKYHRMGLHHFIGQCAQAIRPDLIVMDGIEAMEGEGPTRGKKKKVGRLVYGTDMLELDIASCRFMGIDPFQVKHIKHALSEGLGISEPAILSDDSSSLPLRFELPREGPKKVFNFYSWKNFHACAEDEHAFEAALHLALRTPKYWFTFLPKFLYYVLLRQLVLLRGKEAIVPPDYGPIICLGDCTEEIAKKHNFIHVPGCPPQPEDILRAVIEKLKFF